MAAPKCTSDLFGRQRICKPKIDVAATKAGMELADSGYGQADIYLRREENKTPNLAIEDGGCPIFHRKDPFWKRTRKTEPVGRVAEGKRRGMVRVE